MCFPVMEKILEIFQKYIPQFFFVFLQFLDQNPIDLLLVQLSKSFVQNRSSRPVLTSQEEEILAEVKKRKVMTVM